MMQQFHSIEWVTRHAQIRAMQRFGLNPPAACWLRAVLDILDGIEGRPTAILTRRNIKGCGADEWLVMLGSVPAKVIWAPPSCQIITCYQPGHAPLPDFRPTGSERARMRRREARDGWAHDAIGYGG